MPRAVVLGAGMVGSVIAADLAADDQFEVAIADRSPEALRTARQRVPPDRRDAVRELQVDLTDTATIRRTVEPFDIVLGALASRIGFRALRAVIEAGRSYCDISFMPEDAISLDDLARQRGVTAVVDCGVAPGMSNLLVGYACSQLDRCDRVAIYVGGLPVERRWPFQYKAGFSPHDVIEEYTRPARIVTGGRVVTRAALTEPELLEFAGLGTLEAFNTDGLRSLAETIDAPEMVEKTLRYPGHRELMAAFAATGLFDTEPIEIRGEGDGRVGGAAVRPRDVLAALMFPKWTYGPDEADLTVMRVIVEGEREGQACRHEWNLVDRYDPATGFTSMARTTAFPCVVVAKLIATGVLSDPGVMAPEVIGRMPGLYDRVLSALSARGVEMAKSQKVKKSK